MDLNSILFPAPKSSYSTDKVLGELIWIPKNFVDLNDDAQCQHSAPELRPQSPPVLSYDTELCKIKKKVNVADSVFKLTCKESELDDISIITTASSKKAPLNERQGQNEVNGFIGFGCGDSLLEQELNPAERVVPFKPIQKSPLTRLNARNDSDSDTDPVTSIEDPILKLIPNQYKRMPKASQIEGADFKFAFNMTSTLHQRKKSKGISLASKKQIFSYQLKQPSCELQQPEEKKPHKSLSSIKNRKVIENNLSIKIDEMVKVNSTKIKPKPKPSRHFVVQRDQRKSNFDPDRMDECIQKKTPIFPAGCLFQNRMKNFSKPIIKKPLQKHDKIEEDENVCEDDEEDCKQIEIDHKPDTAREYNNPATTRSRVEDCYMLTPKLCMPNSSGLVRSLVSPPPMKRFEMRLKQRNENANVNSEINTNSNEINVSPMLGIISPTETLNPILKPNPSKSAREHVPCMLLRSKLRSSKMMIYFHGNGEDVNLAFDLLAHVRDTLKIHVVAVEYPGYGIYKGTPNESKILEDAEAVYDYFVTNLKVDPQDVIIFGRSIGSGPASYLASKKNIGALVLMSAFTSIRSVVKDLAGSWATYLIKERFDNLNAISKVTCPTFIVHGQSDTLIPFNHSKQLHDACNAPSELVLPKKMDHIEFDFFEDFSRPLIKFMDRCGLRLEIARSRIAFPKTLFAPPSNSKS